MIIQGVGPVEPQEFSEVKEEGRRSGVREDVGGRKW